MGKINVLSFEVANLIAAGEVVDRPASAIKEMMENSIDAGATHITVEIQNGGVSFMRVTDDGCGMTPEDLPMAIRRHATSKIREAEDLDGIMTLGFRGEALAAISSVSNLRIISKMKDAPYGGMLEVEFGQVMGLTERGCSDGTTIIGENLFANVPARRKFLKRDVTEASAVAANVEKVALSHPEIAFRFISDGNVKLETAGDGNLRSAVWAVSGREFAEKLIEINGEFDEIKVAGFIGRSDNVKANRNSQNFFINHRYVKSKTASAAIEQAYVSYLPPEKFPVCVMFIDINPKRVDVNVHPAKLEVKFSNEKPVFEAVYYTVKQALEANTERPQLTPTVSGKPSGYIPNASGAFVPVEDGRKTSLKSSQMALDLGKTDTNKKESAFANITAEEYVRKYVEMSGKREVCSGIRKEPELRVSVTDKSNEKPVTITPDTTGETYQRQTVTDEEPPLPEAPPPADDEPATVPNPLPTSQIQSTDQIVKPYRFVGEVFNSYLIVEWQDKMLLVDKHAAHERIIFERLKSNMLAATVASQMLLLPVEIMLTSGEICALNEYKSEIEAVGFSFETARNTVFVNAIPCGIEAEAVEDMLTVIAGRIESGTGNAQITRNIIFEKALFQASCKAAIKAGRSYPEGYAEWIAGQLMTIPDITFCPHGRPVAMELSKAKLDHYFERT